MNGFDCNFAGLLDRRTLLRWLAGTGILPILPGCTTRPPSPGACTSLGVNKVIDVHCHFFNASDVSVEGFVRYVVLEEERQLVDPGPAVAKVGKVVGALLILLLKILTAKTILAADEAENIKRNRQRETDKELDERQTDAVSDALLVIDKREYVRVFANNGCVKMVTPSFLDMHRWLGAPPASSIESQVAVMDELQRTIFDTTGVHMHSMVGFDPRRAAEDRHVMEVVEHAIFDCGFVGVKLYPPMGFRPIENEDLRVPDKPTGPSGQILNDTLMKLYRWCADKGVPIMAHAEDSLGAECEFGKRASPEWWGRVLAQDGLSTLRINLAHFGGFDEVLNIGKYQRKGLRCKGDEYSGEAWEDIIGKIIKDDQREYLFADLSYLSELAIPTDDNDRDERPEILRLLEQFRESYDPNVRHLMYGTDWTMIAKELDNNSYLENLETQLRLAKFTNAQLENVYWRNACRYLGLGRDEQTRGRLETYCDHRGIDPLWLASFDT
ncbi:amidohydrolase family protein [Mesorhizobium sp.]|uniref:amidohydrolase family protein n=1 Tax=Mesorhizobium sp. TaxID=1871066 RepID=UPI000FE4C41C|nr:amidohydrolase family protein [Mesorhizobium sp.]RWO20281.1 MAG: hypothetical protein EOS09_27940 [Mesorhizobium sp.]